MNAVPTPDVANLVLVTLNGKPNLLRDFGSEKDFLRTLELLLVQCGCRGEFTATVTTKIKGRPHTQGFQLGSPNLHRRLVEVRWQSGGNDTRFSTQVSVPHGMDTMEFHRRLDVALQNSEAEAVDVPDEAPPDVLSSPAAEEVWSSSTLTEDEIELFLREIVPSATPEGVVSPEPCIDVLRQLGRQTYEADLQGLIEAGYLELGGEGTLLRVASHHLERLRASSDTQTVQTELFMDTPSPQPTTSEVPSLVSCDRIIAEVTTLSGIVNKARECSAQLPALQQEVTELEGVIAQANARLAVIRPRLDTATAMLQDPAVVKAEETLSMLKQLLGSQ